MNTILCHCGCGHATPPAPRTYRRLGHVKGKPLPYIPRHGWRSAIGKRSRAWKGGRYIDRQGYVLVYQPGHPNARQSGYVLEHRLVVEAREGRLLAQREVVHHDNRAKADNRSENLVLTAIGAHERLHVQESLDRMREAIRKLWQDPRHRQKILASTKTPRARAKQGASMRRRWQEPEFRARMLAARQRQ